jgi:hypothetical protein
MRVRALTCASALLNNNTNAGSATLSTGWHHLPLQGRDMVGGMWCDMLGVAQCDMVGGMRCDMLGVTQCDMVRGTVHDMVGCVCVDHTVYVGLGTLTCVREVSDLDR